MRRLMMLLALLFSFSHASDFTEGIKSFFQRQGFVVSVEGDKVIIDLGRGQVRERVFFEVIREGKDIVHPVTGKVLGKERQRIGRVRVVGVQELLSVARIEEGTGIRTGDALKLYAPSVCYSGSEEGFFRISALLEGVKKGTDCPYVIKELRDGFGVEFMGTPVAFYEKPAPVVSLPRAGIEDLNILARSKFIKSLPGIPLSADIGDILGNRKDFLLVLYSGRLEVYELTKNDIILRTRYSLPAGIPVSVVAGKIGDEDKDYILVNMISGDSASSLILKAVGDSLIPIKTNIPYIMGILDKKDPKNTFVGQKFDFSNKFGQTVKLSLVGSELKESGVFASPRGFRVDSAFAYKDYIVFTDSLGRVKVYRGGNELFSTEEGFGGSYTGVQIPVGDQGRMNYVFNPRGTSAQVLGFDVAFVVKNTGGLVQRFLDILKYSQGELYMVGEKKRDLVFIKQVRGATFEETVQAVVRTSDGRILILTGKTGTIPVQNKGDLYELELRLL